MIEVSVRCLGFLYSPRTVVEKAYLSMNSAILSHKIKEDKKASSFKLATECPWLTLSQNSLDLLSSPLPWWPGRIHGESKHTQLRSKQGQKDLKTCKIQKRIMPKHKTGIGV